MAADDKDPEGATPPVPEPPEVRRRGTLDTLYSASWFDSPMNEEGSLEELLAPPKEAPPAPGDLRTVTPESGEELPAAALKKHTDAPALAPSEALPVIPPAVPPPFPPAFERAPRQSAPTLMPFDSPFGELDEDEATEMAAAPVGVAGAIAPSPQLEVPAPGTAPAAGPPPLSVGLLSDQGDEAAATVTEPSDVNQPEAAAPAAPNLAAPVPEVAQRRGAMDTLYSAQWFDEDEAKKAELPPPEVKEIDLAVAVDASDPIPPPSTKNLWIAAFVGVFLILIAVCGGSASIGYLLAKS